MATSERSALVELSSLEFRFLMKVISDQAAAMGFQPGRWNAPASLAIKRVILGLAGPLEVRRCGARFPTSPEFMGKRLGSSLAISIRDFA